MNCKLLALLFVTIFSNSQVIAMDGSSNDDSMDMNDARKTDHTTSDWFNDSYSASDDAEDAESDDNSSKKKNSSKTTATRSATNTSITTTTNSSSIWLENDSFSGSNSNDSDNDHNDDDSDNEILKTTSFGGLSSSPQKYATGRFIRSNVDIINSEHYTSAVNTLINIFKRFIINVNHDSTQALVALFQKMPHLLEENNLTTDAEKEALDADIRTVFRQPKTILEFCQHVVESSRCTLKIKSVLQASLQNILTPLRNYIQQISVNSKTHSISPKKDQHVVYLISSLENLMKLEQDSLTDTAQGFCNFEHINLPEFSNDQVTGGHMYQSNGYESLWNNPQEEAPRIFGFSVINTDNAGHRIGYWRCTNPDDRRPFKYYFKISTLFADKNEFMKIKQKIADLEFNENTVDDLLEGFQIHNNFSVMPDTGLAYNVCFIPGQESYFKAPIRNQQNAIVIPTIYPLFVINFDSLEFVYNKTDRTLSVNNTETKKCLCKASFSSKRENFMFNEKNCISLVEYCECTDHFVNSDNQHTLPQFNALRNNKHQQTEPISFNKSLCNLDICDIIRRLNKGYYFVSFNLTKNQLDLNCCLVEIADYMYIKVLIID